MIFPVLHAPGFVLGFILLLSIKNRDVSSCDFNLHSISARVSSPDTGGSVGVKAELTTSGNYWRRRRGVCDGVTGALCSVTVEASVKPHLWPLKISPHPTSI